MDPSRFQLISGRLVDAPQAEWFAVGDGTSREPEIPNLPLGSIVPTALGTPKPEIEVRSSNTVTYTSRTNTTYSAPAGLVDGDIIVIFHALFGIPPTPTPPSGFALYDDGAGPLIVTDGAYSGNLYLYWKRASSESGSYTVTHATSNSAGLIVAYKNCLESGTPFAEQSADNSGTTTLGIANSLVTTADRSRLIFMEMDVIGGGGLTPPDGMVERCDLELYIADQRIARSGETSATRRHTNGGTAWATRMVEMLAGTGSGTTTGVGAASGTGATSLVGKSTARSPSSASGLGTFTGAGRSVARADFSASGTGGTSILAGGKVQGAVSASGQGGMSLTPVAVALAVVNTAGDGATAPVTKVVVRAEVAASGVGQTALIAPELGTDGFPLPILTNSYVGARA